MKNYFLQNLSDFKNKLILELCCLQRLAVNLLWQRKLSVKRVWCANPVVIENQPAQLMWEVGGCHKIIVKNFGTLCGDQNSISIILAGGADPVEIYFYGAEKKIKKSLWLDVVKIELLNQFDANSKMPQVTAAQFSEGNLASDFVDLETALPDWENSSRNTALKVEIPAVQFEFDQFNNHNQTLQVITQKL